LNRFNRFAPDLVSQKVTILRAAIDILARSLTQPPEERPRVRLSVDVSFPKARRRNSPGGAA